MPHDKHVQQLRTQSDGAPIIISWDISGLMQEFVSSGERGLLDMVMGIYDTAFSLHLRRDAPGVELVTMPVHIFLQSLGDTLMELYNSSRVAEVLEIAIVVYDQVLKLRPEGHEDHAASVLDLGLALQQFCAEQSFAAERLDLAIALL
jgi:hypothetical protein